MSTEEQHRTALLTILNTAPSAGAADVDDLKKMPVLPNEYTEFTLTQRVGAPNRNTASTGRTGWRITTRFVAKTVSNAREMRSRTTDHLRFARVTVGEDISTPIQLESEDAIGDDDGWYSGLSTWTYAI